MKAIAEPPVERIANRLAEGLNAAREKLGIRSEITKKAIPDGTISIGYVFDKERKLAVIDKSGERIVISLYYHNFPEYRGAFGMSLKAEDTAIKNITSEIRAILQGLGLGKEAYVITPFPETLRNGAPHPASFLLRPPH